MRHKRKGRPRGPPFPPFSRGSLALHGREPRYGYNVDCTPAKPDLQLLDTLASIAGHHNKRYCYPSQATILRIHLRRTGIAMWASTLNRKLRSLDAHGYTERTRRHCKGPDGQLELHSTLYRFTAKAWDYLHSLARRIVPWFAKSIHRLRTATLDNLCKAEEIRSLNIARHKEALRLDTYKRRTLRSASSTKETLRARFSG